MRKFGRKAAGVVAVLGMMATWVAMSELLQGLQASDGGYNKPWALTWIIHSSYALNLLPWAVLRKLRIRSVGHPSRPQTFWIQDAGVPVSLSRVAWTTALLTWLSAAVAYTWYSSLSKTTVASNNAIFQSSSCIVFLLSIPLLGERPTLVKCLAVLLSVGGVTLIATSKRTTADKAIHPSWVGYVLLAFSVVFYALFEVFFKYFVEGKSVAAPSPSGIVLLEDTDQQNPNVDPPKIDDFHRGALLDVEISCLYLGLIGVWSAVLLPVGVPILAVAGVETFEPVPLRLGGLVALNCCLDALFNMCLFIGLVLTSPLFISVGSTLVSPVSIVTDRLLHDTQFSATGYAGAALVILAFLLLSVPTPQHCFQRSPLAT